MTAAVFSPYVPREGGLPWGKFPRRPFSRRAICLVERGKPPGQHRKNKKRGSKSMLPQPYFCVKSRRTPVLAGCGDQTVSAGILTCGSSANPGLLGICREPDRLQSGPRSLPMTGFRLPGGLHAYSGGTVREFHPIPYSPSRPNPAGKALKLLFTFANHLTTAIPQCQQKKQPLFP